VELGCGTGSLSVRLVELAPDASFTFVDAAPEMIETARLRLADRFPNATSRFRFLPLRFEDLALEPNGCELVVSSLSLHHVADPTLLYRGLYACLAPEGSLCVADGYGGESTAIHALHLDRWQAFWREPGNLTSEEIDQVRQHVAQHDHYMPLGAHFRALENAGFCECDCIWRDGLFAIITASAPRSGVSTDREGERGEHRTDTHGF
jgi:tRNA (cmo5U34)-methyltransferase